MSATDSEYLTIKQAGEAYPAIGERNFRHFVEMRRIRFYKPARRILLCRADIEAFIAAGRHDPVEAA